MQLIKSKIELNAIVLLLILAFAVSSVALPAATAQYLGTKKTYAVCGLMPNPVGVGQEVLVWLGITDQLQLHNDGWEGLTVTVTKPDNSTETLGPFRTDSTGSTGTSYTPNTVGTYYFQTHFPKQNFTWTPGISIMDPTLAGTITYAASDSPIVALNVQQEPIAYYPAAPLPTEYWTRPIDLQHKEWSSIAGNWLNVPPNRIAPYNDAPESSHILWAKPLSEGGLVGGEYGPHAYEEGDAYEGKFGDWEESGWGAGSSVIINGILYYNRFTTGSFMMQPFVDEMWKQQGIEAVDLRTGEEVWFKNNTRLTFGQILYWDAFNMHGAFAYLWEVTQHVNFMTYGMDTNWTAYDAMTGEFAYKMTNVPEGTRHYGSKGEILIYQVNTEAGWVALWNSTLVVNRQNTGESSDGSWGSNANTQKTFDARTGYQWNKTMPTGLPGAVKDVLLEDAIIGSTVEVFSNPIGSPPVYVWGINLKPGQEGRLLFNKTWQRPLGDLSVGWGRASSEEGVFTLFSKEDRRHYAFDLHTGEQIWSSKDSQTQLDIFDFQKVIANGRLYSTGYGGVVYAYDIKTGALLWNYTAEDKYNEILWSNNWPLPAILFVTDGKIYIGHEEHSPVDPKPRGAPFLCLNETTGEVIWKTDGAFRQTSWGGRAIIADGIIATLNTYDNRIYAIGKGPTKTSVNSSPKVSTFGSSVVIEGTVLDVSAGTADASVAPRFPNGVAAVSDDSMNDWMEYVYMQFPRPSTVTGVKVTLSVLDGNNNYREIGTTTSNSDGFFTFNWKPDIEGPYTVYASFTGSESYWPSHAVTSFAVDPAAPAAQTGEYPQPIDNTMTIVGVGVAILIAVAIVGAVLAMMLRKRP